MQFNTIAFFAVGSLVSALVRVCEVLALPVHAVQYLASAWVVFVKGCRARDVCAVFIAFCSCESLSLALVCVYEVLAVHVIISMQLAQSLFWYRQFWRHLCIASVQFWLCM